MFLYGIFDWCNVYHVCFTNIIDMKTKDGLKKNESLGWNWIVTPGTQNTIWKTIILTINKMGKSWETWHNHMGLLNAVYTITKDEIQVIDLIDLFLHRPT